MRENPLFLAFEPKCSLVRPPLRISSRLQQRRTGFAHTQCYLDLTTLQISAI